MHKTLIEIFKNWKKMRLCRKIFEKYSVQLSGQFWPILAKKQQHFFAQNTPKHAYFQKLEENMTLSKKIEKSSFLLIFCPKPSRKFIFSKIRRCHALS